MGYSVWLSMGRFPGIPGGLWYGQATLGHSWCTIPGGRTRTPVWVNINFFFFWAYFNWSLNLTGSTGASSIFAPRACSVSRSRDSLLCFFLRFFFCFLRLFFSRSLEEDELVEESESSSPSLSLEGGSSYGASAFAMLGGGCCFLLAMLGLGFLGCDFVRV